MPLGQRLVADTGDEHVLEPVQRELVHDVYLGQVSQDKVQGRTPCSYLLMVKIKVMRVLKSTVRLNSSVFFYINNDEHCQTFTLNTD